MKTLKQIREGIAGAVAGGALGSIAGPLGTAAGAYLGHKVQQAANAAKKKKDDNKPTPIGPDGKHKQENSDAVKAFLAKGGKIKKLPPAKAQGYHGKDDPGKGMAGMMDKGDTKAIGTRKKVKSMGEAKQTHMFDNEKDARAKAKEIGGKYVKGVGKSAGKHAAIKEKQVNELSPATKKSYINKAASDIDNRSYAQGTVDATNTKYNGKNNRKIANRLKGIRRATK